MELSMTVKRENFTKQFMDELEQILVKAGLEPFKTGDTYNQFSFEFDPLDDEDGTPLYGSLKFTLHKENWNWKEEADKYAARMEMEKEKIKNKKARDQLAKENRLRQKIRLELEQKQNEKRKHLNNN